MTAVVATDLRYHRPGGGFAMHLPALRIPNGGALAAWGPSGCGKSTLLSLVAGVMPAASGSLRVGGQELVGLSDAARRELRIGSIGQIFQDFPLVDHLDATENVLLPYRLHPRLRLDRAARQRAEGLLARLGLEAAAARRPRALSQGERQRVAIARALIAAPRLVLADEPTAGLDPASAASAIDLLESLRSEQGFALLLVTHDPAVLARYPEQLDATTLRRAR